MKNVSDLVQELNQSADERRAHEVATSQSRNNAETIANAIGDIKLVLPEVQKMQWELSVAGLQDLLKSHEAELLQLIEIVKNIKPEVTLPSISPKVDMPGIDKMISLLTQLVAKPSFEKTVVNTPDFPSKITVDNIGDIVDKLAVLTNTDDKDEELTGLTFDRDANGNLITLTEIYPSGTVVSTGWNLGRVRISDDRRS